MKLILARVLPVVVALLVPSLAAAEESHDKPAPAHSGRLGTPRTTRASVPKATPKAHKPVKAKPTKALRKSAKNPAKLSKKAAAR